MSNKRVSLSDLSKILGVSKTLVSMVLNGKGDEHKISSKTQKTVLKKAKELNYSPHSFARKLRTGESHLIGLIVPDISNIFFARIARVMEDVCHQHNYNLIVLSSDENSEREIALVQLLKNWQIDGLIVAPSVDDFTFYKNETIPFVMIDRYVDDEKISRVTVDNEKGAFDATQYLISKNKKSILYFNITPSHLSSVFDRRKGFEKAIKLNKAVKGKSIDITFDNIAEELETHLKKVLNSSSEKIDAIFTSNNTIALSLLHVLKKITGGIPNHISICSFDEHPVFELVSPSISSIAQPIEEIGKKAIEILLKKMDKKNRKDYHEQITLPTKLIKRI